MDGGTEDEDGPVGIVVTDWFNLSLYRMARWRKSASGGGLERGAYSSCRQHRGQA